jgi:glycosyltransferase involved in cell wall biosynthesis
MLTETNNKKILLLTLVHPDFLPPVYAVAQVLRDEGFNIHILTFDSFVPSEFDLGNNIVLESAGRHYDAGTAERIKLRNKFTKRALQLAKDKTTAVITFCPFSFHTGIIIKTTCKLPLIYHALELSDFRLGVFLKSPLSNYRNLRALQTLSVADLIATPSIQRSAWLAGRCHLTYMPYTILNTAYLQTAVPQATQDIFRGMVPANFHDKKIILYTGAVNADLCTLELVQAFELLNDEGSALIITGIKDTDYCSSIKEVAEKSKTAKRIKLFPYITRKEMLSLQANAHIGVCLARESQNNVKSKMMAPNKAGEYLAKDLYLLGILSEYLRPIKMQGIASLAASCNPADICKAMKEALIAVNEKDYKNKIRNFVRDFFCMQQQLKPVIKYLNTIK